MAAQGVAGDIPVRSYTSRQCQDHAWVNQNQTSARHWLEDISGRRSATQMAPETRSTSR